MAVEKKRGCGYRKVGGLYLVDGGAGMPCCKMPLELSICPCCGGGIKQSRGWTWVDGGKLFGGSDCSAGDVERAICPAAIPAKLGRVGLVWIGEKFYPTPADFMSEAAEMGISRRFSAVPRDFVAGETWVFFAHPKAIRKPRRVVNEGEGWTIVRPDGESEPDRWEDSDPDGQKLAEERAATLDLQSPIYVPGVIRVCRPRGFEKIVKQSDYDQVAADRKAWAATEPELGWANAEQADEGKTALLRVFEKDEKRGVVWVPVPDNDPDHQGTVYDRDDEPASASA